MPTRRLPPPAVSAAWEPLVKRLHGALLQSDYRRLAHVPTKYTWYALPLEPGNLWSFASGRGYKLMRSTVAPGFYRRLLAYRNPRLERLMSFCFLNQPLPPAEIDGLLAALPGAPGREELVAAGLLEPAGRSGCLRCPLRFVPVGNLLQVSDQNDRSIENFTYIGYDSVELVHELSRWVGGRRFQRALDVGCGSGVQGLAALAVADRVEGVDINPRAVEFANLNARLNGLAERAAFRTGDLTRGLEGPFDLIVSNPPFVWLPADGSSNRDGFGGSFGLELVERILNDLDRLLGPEGEAHLISSSPVVHGRSVLEELLARTVAAAPLGAVVHHMRYGVHARLARFHRSQGGGHVIINHAVVGRRLPHGRLEVRHLPPVRRALYAGYVRLAGPVWSWLAPANPLAASEP